LARPSCKAGFNPLHVPNNHTFDFGGTGLRDTLARLYASRIFPVGARAAR